MQIGGVLMLAVVAGLLAPLSGPEHGRDGVHVVVGREEIRQHEVRELGAATLARGKGDGWAGPPVLEHLV